MLQLGLSRSPVTAAGAKNFSERFLLIRCKLVGEVNFKCDIKITKSSPTTPWHSFAGDSHNVVTFNHIIYVKRKFVAVEVLQCDLETRLIQMKQQIVFIGQH